MSTSVTSKQFQNIQSAQFLQMIKETIIFCIAMTAVMALPAVPQEKIDAAPFLYSQVSLPEEGVQSVNQPDSDLETAASANYYGWGGGYRGWGGYGGYRRGWGGYGRGWGGYGGYGGYRGLGIYGGYGGWRHRGGYWG